MYVIPTAAGGFYKCCDKGEMINHYQDLVVIELRSPNAVDK